MNKDKKTPDKINIILILVLILLILIFALGRNSSIVSGISMPGFLICSFILLARIDLKNKEKTNMTKEQLPKQIAKEQLPKQIAKEQPLKQTAKEQPAEHKEKLAPKTESKVWPKPKIYSDKPLPAPKYICSGSGSEMYYAGTSREEVLEEYLKSVLNIESQIHALKKSGKVDTYTLINSGGPFKDYLEKEIARKQTEKSDKKEVSPEVFNINVLDEEALKDWCKDEKKISERIIWVTDKYGNAKSMMIKGAQLDEKTKERFGSNKVAQIGRYGLKNLIKTKVERHDLKHDPWNPVYPDLTGLTLRDLQVSNEEPEHENELFDEARFKEYVNKYFGTDSDKKIELLSGKTGKQSEQEKAFHRMLGFGRCWENKRNKRIWENAPVNCRVGEFERLYEWETPCWDGGNCGTDTEYEWVKFARYDEITDKWGSLVEEISNRYRYRNKDREDLLKSWKEAWGFAGCADELSTPFVIDGSEMYLLNPFGMKGIFEFTRR